MLYAVILKDSYAKSLTSTVFLVEARGKASAIHRATRNTSTAEQIGLDSIEVYPIFYREIINEEDE